jgi:hypothetical protein
MAPVIMLLTSIHKVPGFNLGQDTNYLCVCVCVCVCGVGFPQPLWVNAVIVPSKRP